MMQTTKRKDWNDTKNQDKLLWDFIVNKTIKETNAEPIIPYDDFIKIMNYIYNRNPSYIPRLENMIKIVSYDFSGKIMQYLLEHGAWIRINKLMLPQKFSLVYVCAQFGNWKSLKAIFSEAKKRGIVVNLHLYDKGDELKYHLLLSVINWLNKFISEEELHHGEYYGDEEDFTKVLEILVVEGHADLEHIPVNGKDYTMSALQLLCQPSGYNLCKVMVQKCIDLGADLNVRRPSTLIHLALIRNSLTLLKMFIEAGADTRLTSLDPHTNNTSIRTIIPLVGIRGNHNFALVDYILRSEEKRGVPAEEDPDLSAANKILMDWINIGVKVFRSTGDIYGGYGEPTSLAFSEEKFSGDKSKNYLRFYNNMSKTISKTSKKQKSITDSCAKCGEFAAKLLKCSRCKDISYCNKECQLSHWKTHKPECKKI